MQIDEEIGAFGSNLARSEFCSELHFICFEIMDYCIYYISSKPILIEIGKVEMRSSKKN